MFRSALARRRTDVEDAFTLIELMVIGLVIAILTAIAVPIFFNQQAESVRAGLRSDVRNTVTNVATFQAQNPTSAITSESQTGRNSPAGSPIEIVVSHPASTVQVLAGDARGEYDVIGSNRAVDFSFSFDSTTGEFVAGTAIAGIGSNLGGSAGSGGGSGSGGSTTPGTFSENLRNLIANPMTVQGGSGYSYIRSSQSYVGGRLQMTTTAEANPYTYPIGRAGNPGVENNRYIVTPGERVSVRARVWNPSDTQTLYVRMNIHFYVDTVGNGTAGYSPVLAVPPRFSAVVEHTAVVPAGSSNRTLPVLYVTSPSGGQIPGAGVVMQHSEWALYIGADGSVPRSGLPYFNGNSPSSATLQHRWLGTPHMSPSVRESAN